MAGIETTITYVAIIGTVLNDLFLCLAVHVISGKIPSVYVKKQNIFYQYKPISKDNSSYVSTP